jgi:hypothetical protein
MFDSGYARRMAREALPAKQAESYIARGRARPMMFAKQLRERVMRGEIACSVRVWQRPRVKVGGRYPLGPGAIHVTSVREIAPEAVTEKLAQASGFESVAALMAVARHGAGDNIYLVAFEYRE